ncbi:Coenzyme F420 hydrogenase/dehydrogenase, beta subunit C-terminal domain [Bacteroides sp.]|uniref:Coenzyme F420 hydrogenase/dehydrogenase, beta subunit C-terminal domain n=1 Tax=Bacteroides sp. TaxID=29523 RepID=UPI002A81BD89|nr:Coenzyme F420 hydrogenase/dehydrogenase, beta subunit C-terminal domain [Bacteroides sp.]
MIQITDKSKCCGCNACGDVCTHTAITFQTDIEGFWYPVVDKDKCTNCRLCEKVCPQIYHSVREENFNEPKVYAAYHTDNEVRMDSTSGGVFSALAELIYADGGYVGGAVYNNDHTVSHFISNDSADLKNIRSSKYLQSSAEGFYRKIKKSLKTGKKVLICGTPCQIEALYNVLSKDYDNLITCDFICRGVNSPKVFLSYMKMLEKKYDSHAIGIKFKAKKWGWHNFSMRINFANGKQYCKDRWQDPFFIGYLQYGGFSRPSCYNCQFKNIVHRADITLADFWGIESIDSTMDQDKGTSLVLVNSSKGEDFFSSLGGIVIAKQFTLRQAMGQNMALVNSVKAVRSDREFFFSDIDKLPFDIISEKYFAKSSLWLSIKKRYSMIGKITIWIGKFRQKLLCRQF